MYMYMFSIVETLFYEKQPVKMHLAREKMNLGQLSTIVPPWKENMVEMVEWSLSCFQTNHQTCMNLHVLRIGMTS